MDQPGNTPASNNPLNMEDKAKLNAAAVESVEATQPTAGAGAPAVNPFTGAGAPKAKKKWLPFAIAGGAVVLLAGGASAYYFGVYQNPDNVIFDAYSKIAGASALQAKGTVTFDMPAVNGFKLKSIEYNGNFENNPSGAMDITAKLVVMSTDVSVSGKGKFMDNGDLYYQLNGLVDAVKAFAKASGAEGQVPPAFYTSLAKIQDQWVKVTLDDMKKSSTEAADSYKCVLDTYKKHKDDSAKPLLDAYKKNTFITKSEDLGIKDGRIGYKLKFDEGKLKSFAESSKDLALYKDLKDCNSGSSSLSSSMSSTDSPNTDSANLTYWIDQWSHELKRVEYSGEVDNSSSKVTFNGNVDLGYNKSIKTEAPSSSISLEEFMSRVDDITSEMYGTSTYSSSYYEDFGSTL